MEKKLTQREIEEQELANKIKPLIEEREALYDKRSNGVTLEKNDYIGDRHSEIEKEISKLKPPKKEND